MTAFIKLNRPRSINLGFSIRFWRPHSTAPDSSLKADEEEEFRVLDLMKKKTRVPRKVVKRGDIPPDRAERMAPDQNWGNVWPGPRTFHPSAVPLPLHQGYVAKGQAPPGKKANAELMKIPNFLHLTPPVIRMQCEAIKQFCTPWPKKLDSEAAIEQHYPLEVITSDYCHASPSIRNPLARIVTVRIKLSNLNLNARAKDKFLRLVGDRYDRETDVVTVTADRCPARKQNLDYVMYLLTASYHESWNVEDWEAEKTEEDMEYYDWENNASRRALVDWYLRSRNECRELSDAEYKSLDIAQIPNGDRYKVSVSELMNVGENAETLKEYGASVRALLGLPDAEASPEERV